MLFTERHLYTGHIIYNFSLLLSLLNQQWKDLFEKEKHIQL